MTHHIPESTREVHPAEVVRSRETSRIVRVSGCYNSPTGHAGGIQETYAELTVGTMTLCRTSSKAAPETFGLNAEEMDTLCQTWQQFRLAQWAQEDQERAAYEQDIKDLQARVSDLGGTLVTNDELDSFDLAWPAIHPMHGLYTREDCLSRSDVEDRLEQASQLIKQIQEGTVHKKDVRSLSILDIIATAVEADIITEGYSTDMQSDTYTLKFAPDSPFNGFWTKETGLTLAHVDYRLRYIADRKTYTTK